MGLGYLYNKLQRIAHKVDMSVDTLAEKTPVDISTVLIDKAVQRAVDREVGAAVSAASNTAVRRISDDMDTQIRRSVAASYSNIEDSVSTEVARQVSNLDINRLKQDVTAKAKQAVVEKFDGHLDDIIDDFKKNLENVSKIYGSIANTMIKKPGSELVFKINQ